LYDYKKARKNMRMARIKPKGITCYHVCSRIVNRDYRLTVEEKRAFLELMRKAETFSGVTVLDYCLMDNHFHLLVEVPAKEPISDAELFRRIQALYGDKAVTDLKKKNGTCLPIPIKGTEPCSHNG